MSAPAGPLPVDTPSPPVIVWLRNDLRLDDHEPLVRAVATGAPVVPVYCIDPRHFGRLPSGVPKTGAFRARFLLESLADLRELLRARGGDLVVRRGMPEVELPEVVRALGATRVFCHAEVASEETSVESRLISALAPMGVAVDRVWGYTLHHPDDLPFPVRALPELFTSFRQQIERDIRIRMPVAAPKSFTLPPVGPGELPTLESLGLSEPADDPRVLFRPRGGATAGMARLKSYLWETDQIAQYKETRNGMLRVDDSSKLSPWLAMGCLSPRRVWGEVQRYEKERVKNDSTYWLVFELRWRDFFRFVALQHGDAIFAEGGLQRRRVPWRTLEDARAEADFASWCEGSTGLPLVDASMRELAASGFTSNRARQNVASHLTQTLRIDWRLGAEWFESLLVDYDVASNWGNWMYAAGVGNDARGTRAFNVAKQAATYDPDGSFVRHWLNR